MLEWVLVFCGCMAVALVGLELVSAPIEWLWPYQLKGNTHWHGQTTGNRISLTFDDGPSRYTERILDILRAADAPATFFAIGIQAERYPETMRRMGNEGHEIGNHTHSFPAKKGLHLLYHPVPDGEIERAQATVTKITGTAPRFFRSPAGQMGRGLWRQIREHGLEVVYGALPVPDVHADSKSQLNMALANAQPGAIIILHDGDDQAPDSDRPEPTVDMLLRLLERLQAKGLKIVPLEDLLYQA